MVFTLKNNAKRLVLMFACIFLLFGGCSKKQTEPTKDNTVHFEKKNPVIASKFLSPEQLEAQKAAENNSSENDKEQEEPAFYINPLTGLKTEKDLTGKRPVAVMINNIHLALPQIGISEADIVYEILEEGGITRLLAIYNDYEDIPEIGSVRSARDYYVDIADAHDAIFVHAGGSTYAYSTLQNRKTNNIDGLYTSNFYRSAERRKTMASEHTLMISGEGLSQSISDKGYRTTTELACPLEFDKDAYIGSNKSEHIEIPFSIGYNPDPYITSFFDYNSTDELYYKGHFGEPHIDGDDSEILTFKNVITLTCDQSLIPGDQLGCIQVDFTGRGSGSLSVNGTARRIYWERDSRTSSYKLYESDNSTPVQLHPGKTYIALVPKGAGVTIDGKTVKD